MSNFCVGRVEEKHIFQYVNIRCFLSCIVMTENQDISAPSTERVLKQQLFEKARGKKSIMGITAVCLCAFLLYSQICGNSQNVNIASYASRLREQLMCTVVSSCTNVMIRHCRYGQMLCCMSYVYSSCVCKVRVSYVTAYKHTMCMQTHGNPIFFSNPPNSYQLGK